jgi:hypothetical protein
MTEPNEILIREAIRPILEQIGDPGANTDSGYGLGQADIHVTIGGTEYIILIKEARSMMAVNISEQSPLSVN